MGYDPWVVVLVRAWTEGGQLKARLMCAGLDGETEVAYAGSPAEAAQRLYDWLADRLSGKGRDGLPASTPAGDR
jgi:hypothetical protein